MRKNQEPQPGPTRYYKTRIKATTATENRGTFEMRLEIHMRTKVIRGDHMIVIDSREDQGVVRCPALDHALREDVQLAIMTWMIRHIDRHLVIHV